MTVAILHTMQPAGSRSGRIDGPRRACHLSLSEEFFVTLQKRSFMNRTFLLFSVMLLSLASGCLNVKTEPIEVKPIHITVDVNVKVERALDDFFGDLDKKSTTIETPKPATP